MGRILRKRLLHALGRGASGVEQGLLLLAQPQHFWPKRMRRAKSGEALIVRMGGEAQRKPFQRGALKRVGDGARRRIAGGAIAGAIKRVSV